MILAAGFARNNLHSMGLFCSTIVAFDLSIVGITEKNVQIIKNSEHVLRGHNDLVQQMQATIRFINVKADTQNKMFIVI